MNYVDNLEIKRLKEVYSKRRQKISKHLYSYFNPGNLYIVQSRDREIINALKRSDIAFMEDKKILEVGCGTGGNLRKLIELGAKPENLYGIDILEDRIKVAKNLAPNINFFCGNAEYLPYEDAYFDIVMQFTVFTSILCDKMKHNIAKEMLRVVKPSGIILWYDFFVNNPRNLDVKGVKKKEIYMLFQDCYISFKRITLAPPLARKVAPLSFILYYVLEKLKIFNTHYLAIIKKKF